MTKLEKLEKALEDQEKLCDEALAAWEAAEAKWGVSWDAVYALRKEQANDVL
jgi:hypothetical protein